jgi:hypothetical protein
MVLEAFHSPGRAHARGDDRILDSDRQALERANLAAAGQPPVGLLGLARRPVLDQRNDSVKSAVHGLDPLDKSIDHLD